MAHRLAQLVLAQLVACGWLVLTAGPLAAPVAAQEAVSSVEAEMRLEPDEVIGVGEIVTLEIEITAEGSQVPQLPDPDFELENFRILGGPSQATGLTIVNGRPSASRTLTWQLVPRRLGRARVHSTRIEIGTSVLRLADREVAVVSDPPLRRRAAVDPDELYDRDPFDRLRRPRRRPSRRSEAPEIFLRAEISPPRPWVGQQVTYTLSLYTQVDIEAVNPEEFPDFKGFWARVIPQPDQLRPEMVDHHGERFGRVVLLERALFPRRSGHFEIEPIRAHMVARIPDTGPFGSLMPRRREISRTSNPVTIAVREPPAPPVGFQGAVGELELTTTLEPRELAVGEAATLTLHLAGRGHLQGLPAPALPEAPGLQVFAPQQRSTEELRGQRIHGSRTWSYVLVPRQPGDWQVPTIEIPYFDPRRGDYQVVSTPPLALQVAAAAGQPAAAGLELRAIRTAALPAVGGGLPDLGGWRPWLFALPWLAAAVLLVRRRLAESPSGGAARRHLLERLGEATDEERPRQAAACIEDAWRAFLEERFEIPPGTASPQWATLLEQRGMPAEAASELVRLADDLHYLRYAPKLSSIDELRAELLERSRKLARTVG